MEELPEKRQNEIKLELSEQGYVTLPFNKDEFKEFVVGLLGKPQIIEGTIKGPFEIDINNVRNVFELVNQRITQQNDGLLVQFNARIIFSDDTSVLINSLEELITYNVIKPVITESLHLTFQYLIKFQDKKVPEKQEINISFVTTNKDATEKIQRSYDDYIRIRANIAASMLEKVETGFIQYTIKHTARTWGTDIESILANHFKSLIVIESPIRKFLKKHNGLLSFILFIIVLGLGILLTRNIHNKIIYDRNNEIENTFKNRPHSLDDISSQIKFLAHQGFFDTSSIYILGIFLSLMVSVVAMAISTSMISKSKRSYVLLSSESYKNKTISEKEYSKQFKNFVWSIIISILCGLATNFIFLFLNNPK